MKHFLIPFLLCVMLLPNLSIGQRLPGLHLGMEGFIGQTFLHSPDMRFDIPNLPWGGTAEAMFQTNGGRYWHQMYAYPRFGVQFTFKSFGNDTELGHAIGLVPQIDLPLKRTDWGSLWFRFGFGADIITKPYDRVSNPINNAIGTHLNNMTYLGFIWESPLSKRWAVRLGATFTHTSNGAVIMPNLGLNTADYRLGMVYQADPVEEKKEFDYRPFPLSKKILWNARVGLGAEQFKAPNGPTYPVYIVALFASKQFSRASKVNLGLEWNYYPANAAFNHAIEVEPEDVLPQFQPSRLSANLGHEMMFGQVGFLVSLFMYVDRPFQGDGWFGNKLGPIIYLQNPQTSGKRQNYFIAGFMKSHGFVADYVELSVGVSF